MIKNKVILVTGGAGFIGSNLCDRLIENKNIVRCLDNLSTGKIENIEHLLHNSNFSFIEGDIRDFDICKKAVDNVEIVFHQAALGSVPRSINDPLTTNDVNINGFLNMLVASRDAEVKRFIFAASSSTYGDSENLPKVEDIIGKPLSPYAVTKYVNELYADVFYKTYGLETIGLRYFNVYGPGEQNKGRMASVAFQMNEKSKNNEEIKLFPRKPKRDFVYVKDVISANIYAFENYETLSGNYYEVGSGTARMFEDVMKIMNIPYEYHDDSLIPNGYQFYTCSNKRKWMTGWESKWSLEDGLKDYFKL